MPFLRRLLHPLYRRLETDVHPLRYLFLEITRRCNLSCLHCGSDCAKEARARELTAAEWQKFFDHLQANFDPRRVLPVVTGGEPLHRPDLMEILAGLHERGFSFGLVTNGFLLDRKRLELLLDRGLVSITVSLDGERESHDWLRAREGSYDRAVEAISRVARSGVRLFDVVTCVNPRNLPELPEIKSRLKQLGVGNWRLFLIFPKGRAKDRADLVLSDEEINKLMAWIAASRIEDAASDFRLEFSCEAYLPAKLDRAIRTEPYFCRAGISIGSVLADGSIAACPNITASLVQGNIRTEDFKTVWDRKFLPFRDRSWMRQGPCVECGEWGRCLGNSLHLWDDEARRTMRCLHRLFDGG